MIPSDPKKADKKEPNYHDRGYKYLFSHKELVQELIENFLPPELHQMMDFSTLQKDSNSFISEAFKDRADDVIWSVEVNLEGGQSTRLFLYLLIEFQSRVDPTMAVRIMQYVALLYEHLLREHKIDIDLTHGLPPVFPLVLYNGRPKWTAATDLGQLQPQLPAILKRYQPSMEYFLIDESRIDRNKLNELVNAVSLVFQFENAYTREEGRAMIAKFAQAYKQLPNVERIGKVLLRWVVRDLQKRLPKSMINEQEVNNLLTIEDPTMLAENVENWFTQARDEGKREGKTEGKQEGKLEMALEMVRRFNVSVKEAAETASVSVNELMDYIKQREKS